MVFVVRGPASLSRPDIGQKVVKAKDFWAYKEAEEAIAEGKRRHAQIIQDAHAAYAAEQQRGYREGREAAKLEQAGNMVEIVGNTVEYFSRIENQMADLVMDAVRRIITDFNDRERVVSVVRNSLSLVRSQKHLTLKVHSEQVEAVRSQLDALLSAYPTIALIDVVGDDSRQLDECLVESDIGSIQASISGQLEALQSAFEKVFSAAR